MKNTAAILGLVSAFSTWASAGDIYRCGDTYTDKPCGHRVLIEVARPSCDDRVAAVTRHYEAQVKLLSAEYSRRELEIVKAKLAAPTVIQNTTVTAVSSSTSGAVGAMRRTPE